MNNVVEFIVKMRDQMSSGMIRMASTSQSSFGRMSAHANSATTRNQVLAMSFVEIQKRIQETEAKIKSSTIPSQIAEARRELEHLQRRAANHPGNMSPLNPSSGGSSSGVGIGNLALGSMIGNFATGAISKAADMAVDVIGSAMANSLQKEQAIIGLKTFLGEKGAKEAYANIRKDADATPFDTASLLMVNRSLISAGLNARDSRRDTLNLANAISAVGGGNDELSRMAANMQQIKTVGKATAMDIRQFGMTGINIYEMLARSTGKSINQVKEMDVTYEQLAKSLEMAHAKGGIYEGALEAQSQTKGGKWNTVKDKFANAAVDVLDKFSPIIDKGLDLGIRMAEGIGVWLERAQPLIDGFVVGFEKVASYVDSMLSGTSEWSGWIEAAKDYAGMVFTAMKGIAVETFKFVASIIDFIKKSELLKDLFRFIGWVISKAYDVVRILISLIATVWDNVLKPILEGIDALYKWIKGGNTVKTAAKMTVVHKAPAEKQTAFDENRRLSQTNQSSGQQASSSVVGGGPRTLTINVSKFFDTIQFTTMNNGESVQELEKLVLECFGRVLYNGAKSA